MTMDRSGLSHRKLRHIDACLTGAVEYEMGVAGGGAVRNHRHRLRCGMGRVHVDLDVEHGGQPAEALGADTLTSIRDSVNGGAALGSPGFVARMSRHAGRPMAVRRRGRPKTK